MNRKVFWVISGLIAGATIIGLACGDKGAEEECPPPTKLAGDSQTCPPPLGAGAKTSSTTTGTSGSSGSVGGTCSLTDNTSLTSTTNAYGCTLLTRDVSSCQASREAQGLSGFWLKFSCRVTLTKSGDSVIVSTENLPDYKSFYFSPSDACYEAFSSTARAANPNLIASQTIQMTVPFAPTSATSATATPEGVIGISLNGIALYDNSAAPGDDIYDEEATFDKCDGHPDMFSRYHYHTEPSPVSYGDSGFVGIMRDGFPIYGRNDYATGAVVTGLDSQGGKTSTTIDSPATEVYHYHLNLQSNGTKSAYFVSAGYYKGSPGSCVGCE